MSRKSKGTRYKTEYCSSFQWSPTELDGASASYHNVNKNLSTSMNSSVRSSRHSAVSSSELQQQYRHKLKQCLLEKLVNLESAMQQQKQKAVQISHRTPRRAPAYEQRHRRDRQADWRQAEWQRSRSVAAEVKWRNETSQIWWLHEPLHVNEVDNDDEEDEDGVGVEKRKRWIEPLSPTQKRVPSPVPLADLRSPSIYSRSSLSGQMAQATGYTSTTQEEVSSFDTRSTNGHYGRKSSTGSSLNHDGRVSSRPIEIPVLHLGATRFSQPQDLDQTPIDHSRILHTGDSSSSPIPSNSEMCFYTPYQKEDFVKDTTTSESCQDSPNHNPDTFRLDK